MAQQQIQQRIQQQEQLLHQQLQQQAEQARQQAAALALQQAQQRQAAEQLEQAQREQAQLLAQQNEAAQQQAQEAARRQQAEALAQQQAEQRARQQAQQAQQQADQAAQQQAQQAAQQQAQQAAQQREQYAAAPGQDRAPGAATPAVPRPLPGAGDLASRALAQARTLDFRQLQSSALPTPPVPQARRYSIFNSVDNDVGLALYMQSWRLKIERNGSVNYSRRAPGDVRIEPLVTVSIRSDGSVEEVLLNRSSGNAELDQAVRRIVRLNARYSVFPPALASKYDVIEIRRIWRFDEVLTLVDEVR